jgi:hypothetical protein
VPSRRLGRSCSPSPSTAKSRMGLVGASREVPAAVGGWVAGGWAVESCVGRWAGGRQQQGRVTREAEGRWHASAEPAAAHGGTGAGA